MARNSLPDSLEMLLDTMCNTFGGVMFITLSLSLMVFMCHRAIVARVEVQSVSAKDVDVEQVQAELADMEEKTAALTAQLADIQKHPAAALSEAAKQKQAKLTAVWNELEEKRARVDAREKEYAAIRAQIAAEKKSEAVPTDTNAQQQEETALQQKIAALEAEIKKLDAARKSKANVVRINFSREYQTNIQAYDYILEGNTLYRVGYGMPPEPDVRIKQSGNSMEVFPVSGRGTKVSAMMTARELEGIFEDAGASRNKFVRFFVNPDSITVFVQIRRCVRELHYKLYWEPDTRYVYYFGAGGGAAAD